jgi:hypothetical protein
VPLREPIEIKLSYRNIPWKPTRWAIQEVSHWTLANVQSVLFIQEKHLRCGTKSDYNRLLSVLGPNCAMAAYIEV